MTKFGQGQIRRNWNKKPLDVRFWKHVNKTSTCWLWTGSLDKLGYGRINDGSGSPKLSHRVSLMIHGVEVPNNMCVLHICDNPTCVNPNHLKVGTKHDNNTDMANKRRSAYGEKNGRAKLTKQQALEINELHGKMTRKQIAEKYGIAISTVSAIFNGSRWKYLR